MVSSMLSLFTHGVLADELAFAFLVIKEDSVPLFWLFAVFVVFSGITLLNMLIGVLCQVVADNSREHEKNQILVDLKSSLEDAFEALDTSQDGIISEEEFKQMKTDPNVMEIFFRLGMEESAIIQRLDHMQETIFAVAKSDNADESFLTDSKDPASRRPPSMSFKQFTDQVVDLQMNTSAGVLDVQSVAAKVRAEDQKILTALSRLEPDLRRLLQAPMDAQEAKTLSSSRIQTLNLAGEDSTSVRPQSTHAACPGQASQASPAPRAEPLPDQSVHLPGSLESRGLQAETKVPEQASDKEAPELREDWLQEVPTELLLYILKARVDLTQVSPCLQKWLGEDSTSRKEQAEGVHANEKRPTVRVPSSQLKNTRSRGQKVGAQAEKLSSPGEDAADTRAAAAGAADPHHRDLAEWVGCGSLQKCLDFSDNDLIKLGNFPPLKRLRVLMLMNNRISRIAPDCFDPIPNIVSLVLTGNKLEKLVDLEPITQLKNLERLSLMDNPVTKVKHFRPYMIHKSSKTLRILDFNRIKDKERKAATLLFAGERGKKLLEEIAPPRVVGKEPTEKVSDVSKSGPSPEVIERIKKAIAEAETIEEVTRLEKALKSGVLPDDLKEPGTEGPEAAPGLEGAGGPEPMAEG
ncbi:SNRPA1 [Symbiodinium necroappetens]|uniref:SNRPA1 protein n=1 Tax=Symbiodinium necroappetens TaxID=1628268 RepID=A0A812MGB8_9DINO|nr:SNRPA1 [Symbiodinium necroappetens]